jgi:hypothetical protein
MFLLLCMILTLTACGGAGAEAEGQASGEGSPAVNETSADALAAEPSTDVVEEATAVAAVATALALNETGTVTVPCEDYFRYCVTATVSGDVTTAVTTGTGSTIDSCNAWAAEGEPRVVELPFIVAAGDERLTVALTRIAAYTGPGEYTLQAVVTEGIPDMFPTIEVAGRTFTNGDGSQATVTMAPDGSGSLRATGLVEQASFQVAVPDPSARVDFTMEWTCRDN